MPNSAEKQSKQASGLIVDTRGTRGYHGEPKATSLYHVKNYKSLLLVFGKVSEYQYG